MQGGLTCVGRGRLCYGRQYADVVVDTPNRDGTIFCSHFFGNPLEKMIGTARRNVGPIGRRCNVILKFTADDVRPRPHQLSPVTGHEHVVRLLPYSVVQSSPVSLVHNTCTLGLKSPRPSLALAGPGGKASNPWSKGGSGA